VLSEVIVDFVPGKPPRSDIEAWNNTKERMYVVAEASEIITPGQINERRDRQADPEKLGLLVTPARMILEPGQHKLIRIAAIGNRSDKDRTYRVMIKPVAGEFETKETALKIMMGYDVLVVVRPDELQPKLEAQRAGRSITFQNNGNTNIELIDGRQCDAVGKNCKEMNAKRLYPGASWAQTLPYDTPLEYSVKSAAQVVARRF
jgi:P pilus assembly chaperone PapD